MGFCFSSPDKKEILADNREMIESNARVLSVCAELAEGELGKAVERVYDAVRYMIPSTAGGAAQAASSNAARTAVNNTRLISTSGMLIRPV